uniref:Uncharacterized protein n=1 Tax=Anguilla anguilla TaxID=7936 RepID=A0A0E9RJ57_ANGAN
MRLHGKVLGQCHNLFYFLPCTPLSPKMG